MKKIFLDSVLKPFRFKSLASNSGMTIIEILIVIALIGTIMTIVMTNVLQKSDEAKVDLAKISMKKLGENIQLFRHDANHVPQEGEGLEALIEKPASAARWKGPYTEPDKLEDPWGNKYVYQAIDRTKYTITSVGPDGEVGTDDDLTFPESSDAAEEAPITTELQVPVENP